VTTLSTNTGFDAPRAMDRIYRFQRHVYDATRAWFLFGRDGLLAGVPLGPGVVVLEVGCGTARNLLRLADRRSGAVLLGVDASSAMLKTARGKLARRALGDRVRLAHGLAEGLEASLDGGGELAHRGPLDAVVFSYALSMIPPWRGALEGALAHVRVGGTVHVVDFWDQARWPRWFRAGLARWLSWFGVHHRPELLERFAELEREGRVALTLESVGGRYAFRAVLRRLR
jgi:S-adenosylmethionine-diacylgycerolhomoserine-N-methlytransferase